MGPSMGSAPAYKRAFEVQVDRSEVPHGNAQRQQRRRGEMERAGLVPRLRHSVLSASAVVAYVAVGAAATLGRSVTEAGRDALAWVLPRDGGVQRSKAGALALSRGPLFRHGVRGPASSESPGLRLHLWSLPRSTLLAPRGLPWDLVGWDTNGPIHAELCRVVYDPGSYPATGKDCCAFAAEGPVEPGTGYSVLPPTLTGTVQCPTKRGMKTGTFMLKLKETK